MEKHYVVIAGNGETSRANLEALMEDYFYTKGADGIVTVHIVVEGALSPGKTFATQYSENKGKEVIQLGVKDSLQKADQANTSCFILWSDEDSECQKVLAVATQMGIPCFDLTEGLLPITASNGIEAAVEPVIPVQENLTPPVVEEPYVEPEDEDVEEDGEEEEAEYDEEDMDSLYFGVEAIAKIFAKAMVKELTEQGVLKPSKAPEA
jgi:hypothetical protein